MKAVLNTAHTLIRPIVKLKIRKRVYFVKNYAPGYFEMKMVLFYYLLVCFSFIYCLLFLSAITLW